MLNIDTNKTGTNSMFWPLVKKSPSCISVHFIMIRFHWLFSRSIEISIHWMSILLLDLLLQPEIETLSGGRYERVIVRGGRNKRLVESFSYVAIRKVISFSVFCTNRDTDFPQNIFLTARKLVEAYAKNHDVFPDVD